MCLCIIESPRVTSLVLVLWTDDGDDVVSIHRLAIGVSHRCSSDGSFFVFLRVMQTELDCFSGIVPHSPKVRDFLLGLQLDVVDAGA